MGVAQVCSAGAVAQVVAGLAVNAAGVAQVHAEARPEHHLTPTCAGVKVKQVILLLLVGVG